MAPRKKVILTAMVTLGLFVLAAYWAFRAAGFGHGSYLPALALFPIPVIVAAGLSISGRSHEDLLIWLIPALALLQFALYGWAIGRAWIRGNPRKVALILAAVHGTILLALACYFLISQAAR